MFNRFRPVSSMAVAAAICVAVAASVSVPAAAQDKKERGSKKGEEETKSAKLNPSKGFSPVLKKLGDASKAKDLPALEAAYAEAQPLATTADDKFLTAFYQLQIGILKKDRSIQGQALDIMLDSGLTEPANIPGYNFYSGNFAYGDKNFAKAITRLEAARAAGSAEKSLSPMLMDSYIQAGQVDKGIALAKEAIAQAEAAGQVPGEELYVRPARALQAANRNDELLDILTLRLKYYGAPEMWRNTLMILLQRTGDDKDLNLDILRLMRATKSMTDRREFLEYSGLATEAGYPGEVVTLIAAGRASGVIPRPDSSFDGILETQEPRARADAPILAADATKPSTLANPKSARSTADALVGNGDYAKALPLYQAVITANNDPIAIYRLGVAQALAGQKDAAIASFAKVQGNRERLAKLWTVYLTAAPTAAAPTPAPAG